MFIEDVDQLTQAGLEDLLTSLGQMAEAFLQPARSQSTTSLPVPSAELEEDGIVTTDERGIVLSCNGAAETIWGYAAGDMVGRPLRQFLNMHDAFNPELPPSILLGRPRSGRGQIDVSVTRVPYARGFILVCVVRPRHYSELLAAEKRFRILVEQIPAVTFMAALGGGLFNEMYISPQVEALLGYTQEEWLSDPVLWYWRLHPDDRDLWNLEFSRGCATGGPFMAECRFMAKDGRTVWVHGEARVIRGTDQRPLYLQGVAFDITDSKVAEQKVRASLREKEVLLKEIHHRVKNNLQITSSLLKLQSAQIEDVKAKGQLRESQNRIRSMALVHEKLYQSEDLAQVEYAGYVRSLVASLSRSFSSSVRGVSILVQVSEVFLDIDAAVPCGLIINELVSNAIKHAFPDNRAGTIRVSMHPKDADHYELAVQDDGVGYPDDWRTRENLSLGNQLVATLTRQLEGDLDIKSGQGAEVTIIFPRRATGNGDLS